MAVIPQEIACKQCGETVMRSRQAKYCFACRPARVDFKDAPPKPCKGCGVAINDQCRTIQQLSAKSYCSQCAEERLKLYRRERVKKPSNDNEVARQLTLYAVKIGFLQHPSLYVCMDCKRRQAQCYDHRDYSKPLEVDAVCCRCNSIRGKGIPFNRPKAA